MTLNLESRTMRAVIVGILVLAGVSVAAPVPPPLPVETITIDTQRGAKSFKVEVASEPQSQQRGLMYRQTLAPDAGMLFDFHDAVMLSFWMKNTVLPLDMLFIRMDGTISTIAPDTIPFSTAPITSAEPVRAVLEINGGRARALGIRAGDRVHAATFGNIR
jgi:hypothetical protein